MTNSEQYWQWQQLEPNDYTTRGNGKRYEPLRLAEVMEPEVKLSEREITEREDEYLKSKGIC